tara:strand:+ start:9312 stop:9533 length:222 start_codon:yes stop_codon:yes gene_type:complete
MEDKHTASDILFKVDILSDLVKSLDDERLKSKIGSSLTKVKKELRTFISSDEVKEAPSDWDTFSYDKEKCIAP